MVMSLIHPSPRSISCKNQVFKNVEVQPLFLVHGSNLLYCLFEVFCLVTELSLFRPKVTPFTKLAIREDHYNIFHKIWTQQDAIHF